MSKYLNQAYQAYFSLDLSHVVEPVLIWMRFNIYRAKPELSVLFPARVEPKIIEVELW